MRFFIFLVLLNLTTNVFGGGDSKCSTLENNFIKLLQAFEDILIKVLNLAFDTVTSHPFTGNSYIGMYFCCLSALTNTLVKGTNQLTGVDANYVLGILNGTINPPFTSPLDCIEIELMSFYLLTRNISENSIPSLESLIQESPINESTSCSTVKEIFAPYYLLIGQLQQKGMDIGISGGISFANIGHSDLFSEYLGYSVSCVIDATSSGIANSINMNSTILSAYFANQSISVPPPLSCIKGLVDSAVNTVDSGFGNINNTIITSSHSANCNPFYTEFKTFATIWYKQVTKIRNYATNQSTAYPVLTPYFIAEALCDIDLMILFAANATSHYSGVDSDLVNNFLRGLGNSSLASPLDCIQNDLVYIRNEISTLANFVIPQLETFAVNSTSNTSTCNATYVALTGYLEILITILNEKGSLMTDIIASFASINMSNLFQESYASVFECLPNLVGKYVGTALNVNESSVIAYVGCDHSALSYPIECVKLIIDIINNLIERALINFVTGSPNILKAPKIPIFF